MRTYANSIIDLLNYNLFALGDAKITPLSILYLILLTFLLFYLSRKLRDLLVGKILVRTNMGIGARQAIGTITRYLVLFVGFVIILQTVGINLTTLNVLAGAIGIGIGLGLQNIANNFISGLILLLERPIQAGDRIDIAGITGQVVTVGARATRIRTNDNIAIIVPNSKLISENVVNWSYENGMVRFKIPVMVAHEADVRLVESLMMEAAAENPDVAQEPPPAVRLMKWDEEGIYLELRAWSRALLHKPAIFRSELNFAIVDKLRANNIRMTRNQRPASSDDDDEMTQRSARERRHARKAESERANRYEH